MTASRADLPVHASHITAFWNDVGRVAVRRHETRRCIVREWQSSEPLEAIPRGQIPVPSRDGRRWIGLSGGAVDQAVSQILRRRLVV